MAGWAHRFAVILAAHGFAAVPHGYGEGDFWGAGPIRDVPVEDLVARVRALRALDHVGNVGLFGWSKGAELVLLAGMLLEDASEVAAIAAHAPAALVQGAFDPTAMRAGADWLATDPAGPAAWTWQGAPIRPGTALAPEAYPGPLFLSVGTADPLRDPDDSVALAGRARERGRDVDLFLAEGQGHGFDFDREPELWDRLFRFFRKGLEG